MLFKLQCTNMDFFAITTTYIATTYIALYGFHRYTNYSVKQIVSYSKPLGGKVFRRLRCDRLESDQMRQTPKICCVPHVLATQSHQQQRHSSGVP